MSLPIESSVSMDNRACHHTNGLATLIDTKHTDQLNWLAAAATSPLTSPTWSPESYTADQISASSSISAGFSLDTMNSSPPSHQIHGNSHSMNELPMPEAGSAASLVPDLHFSSLEAPSAWSSTWSHHPSNLEAYYTSGIGSCPLVLTAHPKAYTAPVNSESPASTISLYGESPVHSSYYSSPDLTSAGFANLSKPSLVGEEMDYEEDDDDDAQGGKPYARLIYEALLEAPGHRMMLRDLYDWFEKNTSKPRESGTNGWQNSIRHNLSMNHAFENDKTQTVNARGEPKKATSVWYLTDYALRNGVQSTTRYRKNGGTRRSALHGRPNAVRARSGAKGGRAARRAARFRQKEQSPYVTWASPAPIDNMDPFHHLVKAATSLRNSAPTGSASPTSSPVDDQPYQPCSSATLDFQAAKISPDIGNNPHLQGAATTAAPDMTFEEFKPQDLFLPEHLGGAMEEPWFPTSQIC